MAVYHQGDKGRHCGVGYGASGYETESGKSYGNADCGSGVVDLCLCSTDRTGIYQPAAGGRNRSGQKKGKEIRQTRKRNAR